MRSNLLLTQFAKIASLTCVVLCAEARSQTVNPNIPLQQGNDVVRINSDLVQTDASVFDDSGRFVEGLKPNQFELRVNGQKRSILFFERVAAGSNDEEAKLAAARGRSHVSSAISRVAPLDRGRIVFVYLDDYHLSPISITRVKEALLRFVDSEMGQNDQMGIFAASGQLGFLQQLTTEKAVLRAAINKFGYRSFGTGDSGRTPMSEYEALAITREDRRILDYFVEQFLRETGLARPRGPSVAGSKTRSQAETIVRGRARAIVEQMSALTDATLYGLERLTLSAESLPWRKLILAVSDGFLTPNQDLRRITDAASRSGSVIYCLDARGLSSGVSLAETRVAFDNTGRLASVASAAFDAAQAPLSELALNTGGRAFQSSNSLTDAVKNSLKETDHYYLIAWRPEEREIAGGKFNTIELKVLDRPNLIVRVRNGFFSGESRSTPKKASDNSKARSDPLMKALHSHFFGGDLSLHVSVGFTEIVGATASVIATIETDRDQLDLAARAAKEDLVLDVVAAVINHEGKEVTAFEQRLSVAATAKRVVHNQVIQLAPGLYQVRAAARDNGSGHIGSAAQWIEVPNLKLTPPLLSSLFVGEVDADSLSTGKLQINANHRFPVNSQLGFLTYIYAGGGTQPPDIALQVQVLRDDLPIVTKALVKVETNDIRQTRQIPYGEDLSLSGLPAGKYVLQVTAIDRIAKKSASQRVRFVIN